MGGDQPGLLGKVFWLQLRVTRSRRPVDTIHQNHFPASQTHMKVFILLSVQIFILIYVLLSALKNKKLMKGIVFFSPKYFEICLWM